MRFLKYCVIGLVALSLGACAQFNQVVSEVQGIYAFATTATVSGKQAAIAMNAYVALKGTAVNYANYCISQKFPQPVCSAANRRAVIRGVHSGDSAVAALKASLASGAGAPSTLYNAIIAAIQALQTTPINTVKGS